MKKITKKEDFVAVNSEHVTEKKEKNKWTDELIIAYRELAFQNDKREEREAELIGLN
jgi:hypothetical protein